MWKTCGKRGKGEIRAETRYSELRPRMSLGCATDAGARSNRHFRSCGALFLR